MNDTTKKFDHKIIDDEKQDSTGGPKTAFSNKQKE